MQLQLYAKKIWLYRQAIDFRCSIEGLAALIKQRLHQNPQEGIYLFFNRGKDKIKGLSWHKNGYLVRKVKKAKTYICLIIQKNLMQRGTR